MYEVELKFRVRDVVAAWNQLAMLGAVRGEPTVQTDQYFAHPCRSFAETDEALRVRTVGSENTLTYKGPVIDARTKMRREIEVGLEPRCEAARRIADLLQHLGFQPVRTVAKSRWSGTLTWEEHQIGWTWDEVPPLGTFVELELVVDDQSRESARDRICRLAEALHFDLPERRSYLEMLLEHDQT